MTTQQTDVDVVEATARTGGASGLGGYGVLGVGMCLPDTIVSNAEIAADCGADVDWIERRIGVVERRRLPSSDTVADMAATAGAQALDDASVRSGRSFQPGLLIVAVTGGDRVVPAPAFDVHAALHFGLTPALSVDGACAGFAQGMITGLSYSRAGFADTTLVIGANRAAFYADRHDKRIAPLFGDGAGAFLLGPVPTGHGILAWQMFTHSELTSSLYTDRTIQGSTAVEPLQMRGQEVANLFATRLPAFIEQTLADAGLHIADVDRLFVHQGNVRMVEGLASILGLSPEQVPISGRHVGNTASASLPIGVGMSADELTSGDIVVLVTAGAGLNGAVVVMRWT